jgi:hypothetical protein
MGVSGGCREENRLEGKASGVLGTDAFPGRRARQPSRRPVNASVQPAGSAEPPLPRTRRISSAGLVCGTLVSRRVSLSSPCQPALWLSRSCQLSTAHLVKARPVGLSEFGASRPCLSALPLISSWPRADTHGHRSCSRVFVVDLPFEPPSPDQPTLSSERVCCPARPC